MRKKFSPGVIVVVLFALTAAILAVMFYTQSSAMKRVYGNVLRKDIFSINEQTAAAGELLRTDASEVDAAQLLFAAGQLERSVPGGNIHEGYESLRIATVDAMRAYGEAVLEGSLSADALEKLRTDAEKDVTILHGASQYLMSQLNSDNTNKMDKAYYDAMDFNASVYKRLSTYLTENGWQKTNETERGQK